MNHNRLLLLCFAILIEFAGIVLIVARPRPVLGIAVLVVGIAVLVIAIIIGRSNPPDAIDETSSKPQ